MTRMSYGGALSLLTHSVQKVKTNVSLNSWRCHTP